MSNFRKLKADEIECRVQQCTQKGCSLLLYKTARTDRTLLDETYGDYWQNDFKVIDGKMYGGIGIYNKDIKEWLWRWDCGTESNTEAEKGQASDCFKRAGFKWGIGVELYSAPFIWLNVKTKLKDGKKYELENKFQEFSVQTVGYSDNGDINKLIIVDTKTNEKLYEMGKVIPIKKEQPQTQPQITDDNSDFDIIINVATFNDLVNLTKYFKANIDKTNDKEAFKEACSRRKDYILDKLAKERAKETK
ncbi:MAG: hypothetical protein LUH05_04115 [Candidatus Gastranaerophilales bacterium]|nr:hypothetical protein [Candidatus Gastranaerophilales bacterium]